MLLLLAVILSLVETFWYYRAIVQYREYFGATQPRRGSARQAFAVDELSLVSNPVRMYRFVFRRSSPVTGNHAALGKVRRKIVTSLTICAVAAVLAGVHVLLR